MPSDNDIAGVLLELSRVAAETGIVFEQIIPQATVAAGGSPPADPIVFTGNFYSLSDFLYRLRNLVSVQRGRLLANGRLFAVEKLQFAESPNGFPNIRALLTSSAFLYGTGPVAGAACRRDDRRPRRVDADRHDRDDARARARGERGGRP